MRAFDPENQASYLGGVADARELESRPILLPSVKAAVALASVKGGTGKSSLAVSIAAALAQAGKRVGILDADLAAPAILGMLGLKAPAMLYASEVIEPASGPLGIRALSGEFIPQAHAPAMNFAEEQPEPAHNDEPVAETPDTIRRLLAQSRLGNLDLLIIDLPTGIDPVHRLLEMFTPTGVVLVSQPSALNARALRAALKRDLVLRGAVLGVIENMVGFSCDICRSVRPLFPEGEVSRTARELNLPVIARVPFDPRFAESSDRGKLFQTEFPESPMTKQIAAMAKGLDALVAAKLRGAAGAAAANPVKQG